ncbi:multifunctional transcriptional regulator/nicotinamide-nucleotide adenylyltransferase/ribosylnicotinamide kinase NadR [archaeon]|jgi:HTH-type transcriptional regulator, transcriptional repressor of NAD biosynthesis genes|nr:multifunctional transcriptional regulator/nicotinamide-nucleotide adenylyltransferase/ribosylnicotinamide kinase NadR [archaeon]MBT3577435.1 multifunctional transcriptional regulator/nicotinamide-nucleotide adenylyltransferase/ribosylnicotinamide kinase NadR [archaeon]MBT6820322.1 multifunctional transcriptional regulator/nicotinamide-nucleotide adenylyltransferase/ribosylnicotinamide kinase NadR [archaeon]MBT6956127.1 multifunctional transcriptional regulator/nicotinamide-nucleotide adenylyl
MENKKTVGFIGGKFLPLHQGHIYVIIAASNYVDELYVVVSSSKNRDRELCDREGIKYIPAENRLSWLGEALNNLENIKIIHIEDDQWEDNYDWGRGAEMIKEAIGKPIDFVFSSETGYGELFKKYYPDSKHIVVDDERKTVTTSATELRKNLYDNWDKLPNCVRSHFTKKVAIVGTESCGKSTLAKKLAKFYNTEFVHEVGREYCEKFSNLLTREMFDQIAMEHSLLQLKKAETSNKVLFVDSEATITQYYLEMYLPGERSKLIEEIIALQNYDLVIFLEPDVKWVEDGFRFAGEDAQRIKNNEKLKQMFQERCINFISVDGNYDERFNKSRELVDNLFKKENLE